MTNDLGKIGFTNLSDYQSLAITTTCELSFIEKGSHHDF